MTHEQTLATPSQHRSKWRPALSVWQRFVCEWLFIGSLGVAIVSACIYGQIAANVDRLVYDRLLTLHTQPLARDIAIVCINDESVSRQGRWPWPRDLQARLIDAVARAGAAAIVYDVLLTEPAPGDDELARALHAAPTYLPLFVDPRGGTEVVRPLPRFATAAAASGHIDVEPDPDGIVRGISLLESAGGANWPYIVVPLFNDIRSGKIGIAGGRYRGDRGESMATVVGSSDEAFERAGTRILVPFSARLPRENYFSAGQLLAGNVPPGALRGKVVFVGLTASGLYTHLATPLSGQWGPTSDTLLHANVLSALLTGRAIHQMDSTWLFAISLTVLAILLAGFLFFSPWRTLVLTFGLGVASIALSAVVLERGYVWISPTPALVALLIVYPLWSWRRLEMTMWRLQRELQRLADDADILPNLSAQPHGVRGDALERHIALVEQAADRVQDMKRFVWDCLNSLPEPILIADSEGLVCVANKAARNYFARMDCPAPEGRSLIHALGEFTFIKTIGPEAATDAEIQARWPAVLDLTDMSRVWTVKRGIEVRDRIGRDYLLRYARCRNARGEVSGFWVVGLVEVTALHTAEQAREDALRLLSHDMRSPHASVLALIEEEIASTPSDRMRTLLQHIERYTRRALTLADDFVQLTRAESQAYDFEPVNLVDVVLDASDEIWPQARAKRIRIETRFDSEAHWIRADRSLMTRAISNLLNNAVKYSPNDMIVHASLAPGAPGRVDCRIADQGYGMAEEARAHMFERFRRFRVPGQPHSQGAGLGMALVKTVITRHEGEVKVESEPGRGTTVTVSVPQWDGEV